MRGSMQHRPSADAVQRAAAHAGARMRTRRRAAASKRFHHPDSSPGPRLQAEYPNMASGGTAGARIERPKHVKNHD